MEAMPQVLRHYGQAVRLGTAYLHQALPRLLTVYFDFGSHCCQNRPADSRVRPAPLVVPLRMLGRPFPAREEGQAQLTGAGRLCVSAAQASGAATSDRLL